MTSPVRQARPRDGMTDRVEVYQPMWHVAIFLVALLLVPLLLIALSPGSPGG